MSSVRAAERQSFRVGCRSANWSVGLFAESCCCRSSCRLVGPPNGGLSGKRGKCSTELCGTSRSITGTSNRRYRECLQAADCSGLRIRVAFPRHVRSAGSEMCSWKREDRLSAGSASGFGDTPGEPANRPRFVLPVRPPMSAVQRWSTSSKLLWC